MNRQDAKGPRVGFPWYLRPLLAVGALLVLAVVSISAAWIFVFRGRSATIAYLDRVVCDSFLETFGVQLLSREVQGAMKGSSVS